MPVYFQACVGATPLSSAVDLLPIGLIIAPAGLVCGIVVQLTKMYRPPNLVGWILTIVGFGLLSILRANSSVGEWVGFQILVSTGLGLIVRAALHPQLPDTDAGSVR
jgi:hypothetical protein